MALQSQNIPVHLVSELSNCKMFSEFIHSDVKHTDELYNFSLKLSTVVVIVVMICASDL